MNGVPALVGELKLCGKTGDLEAGKTLHVRAVEARCDNNKYVSAALISMYGKCRSMTEAWSVFCSMEHWRRDVVVWNSLLLGYVENGESLTAMELFVFMDCEPDSFTYVAALRSLSTLATTGTFLKEFCFEKGMEIHKRVVQRSGYEKDVFVSSSLVNMYCKCSSLAHAQSVFDTMLHRDAATWNILIFGYLENGDGLTASDLFVSMNCKPNSATFVAASKALMLCTTKFDVSFCLEKAIALHKNAKACGLDKDAFVASTLIDMYSKCRSMAHALALFNSMSERNFVSWNILIGGFLENDDTLTAMDTFHRMDCQSNSVTFVVALKACASLSLEKRFDNRFCLEQAIEIHKRSMKLDHHSDASVVNTLVDVYSKCRSIPHALAVFHRMNNPDAVAWNSLIHGLVENHECLAALELFTRVSCQPDSFTFVGAFKACLGMVTKHDLPREFVLVKGMELHRLAKGLSLHNDMYVGNTALDMYCKLSCMLQAQAVFNSMTRKDVFSWSSLILGYVEAEESLVAIDLFVNMDCEPNWITFVAVIKACGRIAAIERGRRIHSQIRKLGLEQNTMVATSLVDFYGKCGAVAAAEEVFSRMSSHDDVSWNALISAFSSAGETSQVFDLLTKMQEAGLQPNSSTFLSLLTTCSHLGLVEDGEEYFRSMSKYDVEPSIKHYTCMLDMLQRANRVEEALSLVKIMSFKMDIPNDDCLRDILQKLR